MKETKHLINSVGIEQAMQHRLFSYLKLVQSLSWGQKKMLLTKIRWGIFKNNYKLMNKYYQAEHSKISSMFAKILHVRLTELGYLDSSRTYPNYPYKHD